MTKSLGIGLASIILITFSLNGSGFAQSPAVGAPLSTPAASGSDVSPEVTLRVYNYALSRTLLLRSESEATAIFKHAGLEVQWVDCPLAASQLEAYPSCQALHGTADFVIKILTAKDAERFSSHHEALGRAMPCPRDQVGCSAYIFYRDVVDLARYGGADEYQLLGHALAHEIGHLLLGSSHSDTGIMRANWGDEDYVRISQGSLFFTASQADLLRLAVQGRIREQNTSGFARTQSSSEVELNLGIGDITNSQGTGSASMTPITSSPNDLRITREPIKQESGSAITVLLVNYVSQATHDLPGARKRASAVFQQAGVTLDWHACLAEGLQATDDPTCQPVVSPGKILLRIVPRFETAPGVADRDSLGPAVGGIATVSFGKVEELSLSVSRPRQEILGYARAHEIGHVLLHQAQHSPVGIMRAFWSHEDLELAGTTRMEFTPEEARVIRTEIQARSLQVQAMQSDQIGRPQGAAHAEAPVTRSAGDTQPSLTLGLYNYAHEDSALLADAPAVGSENPALSISAGIYNYAQVPRKDLAEAERVSGAILAKTGIQISWLHCPAPACEQPPGPTSLTVIVLPESMADLLQAGGDVFGFAIASTDGRPSIRAEIFFDRVKVLTGKFRYSTGSTLGSIMAHELGHLLLETSGHASTGIMRARWSYEDLVAAACGWLLFTPEQAERMRNGVRKRAQSQAVEGIAAATALK